MIASSLWPLYIDWDGTPMGMCRVMETFSLSLVVSMYSNDRHSQPVIINKAKDWQVLYQAVGSGRHHAPDHYYFISMSGVLSGCWPVWAVSRLKKNKHWKRWQHLDPNHLCGWNTVLAKIIFTRSLETCTLYEAMPPGLYFPWFSQGRAEKWRWWKLPSRTMDTLVRPDNVCCQHFT